MRRLAKKRSDVRQAKKDDNVVDAEYEEVKDDK